MGSGRVLYEKPRTRGEREGVRVWQGGPWGNRVGAEEEVLSARKTGVPRRTMRQEKRSLEVRDLN